METTQAEIRTEREDRKRSHWRWSGYLTGAFFLILGSLPTAEDREEGAAYAAGAFFGALVIPLAIAFALRLVYVKLIRRDGRPVWSPWLVLVAGVIALLAQAGRLSQES
jgi:formate hydrogenlyase subunit 3/multisubunit Na+/H+ antiporter MnhD subunit